MSFHNLKNHDFLNTKLPELAEHANHVLSSMQVALGFVMACNTAILAVFVAIGQSINSNCGWGDADPQNLLDACKSILCLANFIPWLACAVCAYVGGLTNLVALKIHTHLVNYYDTHLVRVYNALRCNSSEYDNDAVSAASGDNVLAESAVEESEIDPYGLPKCSVRLGNSIVEKIYYTTAFWFFFVCSLFLTCALTSATYFFVEKDGRIYIWIAIFYILSSVALILVYRLLFKWTGYKHKD